MSRLSRYTVLTIDDTIFLRFELNEFGPKRTGIIEQNDHVEWFCLQVEQKEERVEAGENLLSITEFSTAYNVLTNRAYTAAILFYAQGTCLREQGARLWKEWSGCCILLSTIDTRKSVKQVTYEDEVTTR